MAVVSICLRFCVVFLAAKHAAIVHTPAERPVHTIPLDTVAWRGPKYAEGESGSYPWHKKPGHACHFLLDVMAMLWLPRPKLCLSVV